MWWGCVRVLTMRVIHFAENSFEDDFQHDHEERSHPESVFIKEGACSPKPTVLRYVICLFSYFVNPGSRWSIDWRIKKRSRWRMNGEQRIEVVDQLK
jgi:hypothetical protein